MIVPLNLLEHFPSVFVFLSYSLCLVVEVHIRWKAQLPTDFMVGETLLSYDEQREFRELYFSLFKMLLFPAFSSSPKSEWFGKVEDKKKDKIFSWWELLQLFLLYPDL